MNETLSMIVHGEPGVGKSWLGATTPAPRLVLDAEGGSRFTRVVEPDGSTRRVRLVRWDPFASAPPEAGEWETCQVIARDFKTVEKVYEWLNAGQHPFRSLVVDSLTEVQKRCKDGLRSGDEVMNERMWGILLDSMEEKVRQLRDLTFHPSNPLEAVVILALSHNRNDVIKPAVQGALGTSLPQYVDVIGCLATAINETTGEAERRLLISRPGGDIQAKDRTHVLSERYGAVIVNPDVAEMLRVMNSEETK